MGVGGGTGNTISFSDIRDFYGDSNPVVFSDFNRRTSNDGLVDATFAGASTATTTSGSGNKNDFVITETETVGSPTSSSIAATSTAFIPVLSTTSRILLSVSGSGTAFFYRRPDPNSATLISLAQVDSPASLAISGPNYDSSDGNVHSALSAGEQFVADGSGAASVSGGTHITRPDAYDVTFKNNNSTGDTYTLASSSSRLDSSDASQLVYSAQTTRQVKDNSSSDQWTIAYDNVTGSGSGTAGDIVVNVANGTGISASTTHNGGSGTATVTAPSSAFSYVSVDASASNPEGTCTVRIFRNNVEVASNFTTEGGVNVSYTGTINANDVFTATGSSGSGVNIITINYKNPDKVITFQNTGSSNYALGGSSTGGARTINAGNTATVQPSGQSNSQSWAVHFDTSSGDCNVGIPTTIGAGNPVNLNLFNTLTTPVG